MSTESRLDELFAAAVDLPPGRRDAFIDAHCADDPELAAELRLLVEHDERRPESFLAEPAPHANLSELRPGALVSERYRLVETLGEGGMGVVYRATQLRPVRRDVALKLLKPGLDTPQVIARFDAERQALARMDHPNIARIFDAGATPLGRPFVVMELVRGVPITDHAASCGLSVPDRLRLFLHVCEAVQHAHTKGVVHRDLKPSNILVTDDDGAPVPKVIDFGVAKALDERLTDHTLHTAHAQLLGTPEYMSPEQAGSEPDVDTRTDVYALGAVLYELLTGARPFGSLTLRSAGFLEIQRIIREVDPARPSLRVLHLDEDAPPDFPLARRLRGDLDWIVMTAMDKDRSRRYQTAGALAADVRRHLADQPVEAGPPSAAYRLGKFAKRNRALVVTAGVAVVLLCAMTVGMTVLAVGEARALHAAEQSRRDAHDSAVEQTAFALFLGSIITNVEQSGDLGLDATMRDVLDTAARRIAEGELADQPDVEAEVRRVLGIAYDGLGRPADAIPHLAWAHEHQLETLGPDHTKTLDVLDLHAEALKEAYRLDEAEAAFRTLAERTAAAYGDDDPRALLALDDVANTMTRDGRAEEAIPILEVVFAGLHALDHREAGLPMFNRAGALLLLDRLDEAETAYHTAYDLLEPHDAPNYTTLKIRKELAAYVLAPLGRVDEAETILRDALASSREGRGDDDTMTIEIQGELGQLLRDTGREAEGDRLLADARAARINTLGEWTLARAADCTREGTRALIWARRPDRAIPYLEEALEIWSNLHEATPPPPHVRAAAALAFAYLQLGRHEPALRAAHAAADAARRASDTKSALNARRLRALALVGLGRADEAERTLRHLLGNDAVRADTYLRGVTESALGHALDALGEDDEARRLLRRGYDTLRTRYAPATPDVRLARRHLEAPAP